MTLPAATDRLQALCCECGNLRTYKVARNRRGYWGGRDWHRDLGDLKCSACRAVTTHALLADPTDFDERRQLAALGDRTFFSGWDEESFRCNQIQYRKGLPRNPNLQHSWWVRDADKARAAGQTTVAALCGETIKLPTPERTHTQKGGVYEAPRTFSEVEREDPDTGLSWLDLDCVDCLRVWNTAQAKKRRKELFVKIMRLAAEIDTLDAATVDRLLSHIEVQS
ncbi:hypothetical protein [Mycobacterium basiliense]|nr:hypothetical protein [Mycobacterium basiliense]